MPKVWQLLETIPGPAAVPAVWKSSLGTDFDGFHDSFLRHLSVPAKSYPCPRECGCAHAIVRHKDGSIVAVCRCEPSHCDDIRLTDADASVLELNWVKLGRAIAHAFGLTRRETETGVPGATQIAAYGEEALPVILTICHDRAAFRQVVTALAAHLRGRFILFAPTANFMDAPTRQLLAASNAVFLPLDATVHCSNAGLLTALKTLPELLEPQGRKPAAPATPRFALIKGRGTWTLIFNGVTAPIKQEKGLLYVAYLLQNPPREPIHALDLASKIPEIYRKQLGVAAVTDQITGEAVPLDRHARIQERSLGLEALESTRAILKEEQKWEAVLDDGRSTEPERAEALRNLEELAEFQRRYAGRTNSNADNLVRAVRRAITRFYENLAGALDKDGKPHPVLTPFAEHLHEHLLKPSARFSGRYRSRSRAGVAGCFTYEPPPGVTWAG